MIAGTPATSVAVGAPYSFMPASGDADGDRLTFGVDAKPPWATFDATTGRLAGTPAAGDVRMYRGIVVWVSDGATVTMLPAFDLVVMSVAVANRVPQISGAPSVQVIAGNSYAFQPAASDPDNDPLAFTIRNRPPWASFDSTNGRLAGTPLNAGTFSGVVISVTDGPATVSLAPFDIVVTVPALNRAPVISGSPPTAVEAGDLYAFVPTAVDPDNDLLTFAVQQLPSWAAFETQTGRLSGTPPAGTAQTFDDVVISVTDGTLTAVLPAFSIAVTAPTPNRVPVISGSPATQVLEAAPYSFEPVATDADNDLLSYAIANKPPWADFIDTTGRLHGTPGVSDIGSYDNIVISVTDGKATAALPAFAIAVVSSNGPPVISGVPPSVVTAGQPYLFQPTATDPDLDTLTYSIAGKPPWAAFDTGSGRLQGIPTATDAGSSDGIVISVSDGPDTDALPAFSIAVNRPPVISGTPPTTAAVGALYSFTPSASDPDAGDVLTFGIVNAPPWATFSTTTGELQGTPGAADIGSFSNIVIGVSDAYSTRPLPAFAITIAVPNAPPAISGAPATTVAAGTPYSFTPAATDIDVTSLAFSINQTPTWAAFDAATGRLHGTPVTADTGTSSNLVITVSDGELSASLAAFSITVTNAPPAISGTPATTVVAGAPYSFTPTASDSNAGTTLTYGIVNAPAWATFDAATGHLHGTATAAHIGTTNGIVISVSDGQANASLASFSIAVTNTPPLISGTPVTTVAAGASYSFTPTASDANTGTTLAFSISQTPAWAAFDSGTGRLHGTPTTPYTGTYPNIVISVSDGHASVPLAAFSITVTNAAPVISGSPPTTVAAGAAYSFTPTASDANAGTTLSFSIVQTPAWATFDSSTGRLHGTPATTQVGTYPNIVISVGDGFASAPLAAFSITVTNAAPVISGSPPTTVAVGNAYTFTPAASDANAGTLLVFSLNATPPWATFDTATGWLHGTPAAQHVGTYSNLVISVSDGIATVSLPAFAINVQAVATGSALLSWNPPTQNTDGSALTNLKGYKIYWGTALGYYPNSQIVDSPGIASYVVENLVPNTYYFVVVARNTSNVESPLSNAATKTVQ